MGYVLRSGERGDPPHISLFRTVPGEKREVGFLPQAAMHPHGALFGQDIGDMETTIALISLGEAAHIQLRIQRGHFVHCITAACGPAGRTGPLPVHAPCAHWHAP